MIATGPSLIHAMARNALLANYRLLGACARLSEAEYRADRPAFFGSIHETLKHILVVDLYYLMLLDEGAIPDGWADRVDREPAFETLPGLAAAQHATDRAVLARVEALDEAALAAEVRYTRPNGTHCINRHADVLLHLFLHDVHHRGQVHDMLSQTSVPPPQLDEFLLTEDAGLRTEEMAALDLHESG
jgi:uncharacterized damage-inducible protein DinB